MDGRRGRRGGRWPGRGHLDGRGRGRGGGRHNAGLSGGSPPHAAQATTNSNSGSTAPRGTTGVPGIVAPIRACSLRFHADTPENQVQQWHNKPEWNQKWISPMQGFRGASIYVFWDLENCMPGACPELKLTAEDFPVIFRDAFKKDSGASRLKVYGSLTYGFRGDPREPHPIGLQYAALNSKLNTTPGWLVTTADGKKAAERRLVHKNEAEADDQLHSQMQDTILNECKAGDVIIIIGGDTTYKTKVHMAHDCPAGYINVIAIGPKGGIGNSMAIQPDHLMIWENLLRTWSRVLRGRDMPLPTADVQLQQQVLRDHAQRFSVVKEMDLVILMDITGSMQPYLEAVSTKLGEVFGSIRARLPWAISHMRVGFVGYRDFMANSTTPEKQPFVTIPLGEPHRAADSAQRVVEQLRSLSVGGGADAAEDVLGGLMQVVNMLQEDAWGFQSQSASSSRAAAPALRRHRSAAVFHICDRPNHGTSFNTYSDAGSSDLDYYPHGPFTPLHSAVVPTGRVQSWDEEAASLLRMLKDDLNVISYTIAQLEPESTKRMVTAFKALVGDPEPAGGAGHGSSLQQQQQQQEEEEPWITAINFQAKGATDINNKLVRLMVSSSLQAVSRLSQLVHDPAKGGLRSKGRQRAERSVMEQVLKDSPMEVTDQQGLEQTLLQEGIQMGASTTAGASTNSSTSAREGPAYDSGTAFSSSKMAHISKEITQKIKRKLKHEASAFAAKEDMYELPVDMDELVEDLLHTAIHARGHPDKDLQLLVSAGQQESAKYLCSPSYTWQGQQKYVYEAIRNAAGAGGAQQQQLVVMKEFNQRGKGVNTHRRYMQATQGNQVAAFLASQFNEAVTKVPAVAVQCERLLYLPMWTASYSMVVRGETQRVNKHVEPYIIGKYIKYNSNAGYNNMQTLDSTCHAFSHWTYHASRGTLMVVDVQGVKDHSQRQVVLTDPAFHCVPALNGLLFDPATDRGPVGVKEFFMTHVCNHVCQALGLKDAQQELQELRTMAKEGRLPGRPCVMDLDEGL